MSQHFTGLAFCLVGGQFEDQPLISPRRAHRQLLRMAYAHVRMILYRPFLSSISRFRSTGAPDHRAARYAAACVDISRNAIQCMRNIEQAANLNGPHWFTTYSIFFATMSLIFYAWERANHDDVLEILKDAEAGREVLSGLCHRSMAAARCNTALAVRRRIDPSPC